MPFITVENDTYLEALRKLASLQKSGVRLGLERMHDAMERLHDPHRRYAVVHIAGTNGKGSTSAYITTILQGAGFRVGRYTSPHLARASERIVVDGKEISPRDFARCVNYVLREAPEVSFFEAITAMAFWWFAEQSIDVAVVETGLGGRLDATNVVHPDVTVLTTIGFDHTEILGTTLSSIAVEKCGIIKPDAPCVVSSSQELEVLRVIEETCADRRSPLCFVTHPYDGSLTLQGDHQRDNAALAREAIHQLNRKPPQRFQITEAQIHEGLKRTTWPGRLDCIDDWLLDCAHNANGIEALSRFLDGKSYNLLFGAVQGKDVEAMLKRIAARALSVVFTRPKTHRALSPEQLQVLWPSARCFDEIDAACEFMATRSGLKVVTGSIYLVGAVRATLIGEACDPISVWDPLP